MIPTDDPVSLVELATTAEHKIATLPFAERAYAIAPDQLATKIALALALQHAARFEEAADLFQRALVQNQSTKEGGMVIRKLLMELLLYTLIACGKREAAKAILKNNEPLTTTSDVFTQAHAFLGDWCKGFPLWDSDGSMMLGKYKAQMGRAPWWKGESLIGKRAVICRGAGNGDYFMNARFFHILKDRHNATDVVLAGDNEARLVYPFTKADDVISYDDIREDDVIITDHAGLWYGLRNEDVYKHAGEPYLKALKKPEFHKRAPFNVGLVWQGNPNNAMDKLRSMPLRELAPIFAVPATAFYSLQAEGAKDIEACGLSTFVEDLMPRVKDWSDTAGFLAQLDMLITVDSAVNHLAGALGVPTILLNHQLTDWRYTHGAEHTLWYKNHKIAIQKEHGVWKGAVEKARDWLAIAVERKLFQ